MTTEYTWKVESIDHDTQSMVVEYAYGDRKTALNIPFPPEDKTAQEWIQGYAPALPKDSFSGVSVGDTGTIPLEAPVEVETEAPNVVGSWNEEYLRAMIYQVMEEIRESEV